MSEGPKAAERLLGPADLPLEVVILLVAGLALVVTGALLFPVSDGTLAYYEDGVYGLLLVLIALQMIGLGKTPFGDVSRSTPLIAAGAVVAAIGIAVSLIPHLLDPIPRILLFAVFALGGVALLLQMLIAEDRFRTWVTYGGVFRQLVIAAAAVYVLQILIGVLVLFPRLLKTDLTAVAVLIFGAAILYLAAVLRTIYARHPQAESSPRRGSSLSTEHSLMLLLAVFMIVLGVLLIPVGLGVLPFSASAQVGLLMVIFALQLLAVGSTPVGAAFARTWLLISIGLVIAALGIVSVIVPNLLVIPLTIAVGVINIVAGAGSMVVTIPALLKKPEPDREPPPPIMKRLNAAMLVMGAVTFLFGVSIFSSFFLPAPIWLVGILLAANGCVMFYVLSIQIVLSRMEGDAGRRQAQAAHTPRPQPRTGG